MSASAGTIQRPVRLGSISNLVAIAAAVLLAAALAWGALGLSTTRVAGTQAPAVPFFDKGSRDEIGMQYAAPAPAPVYDRGSRDDVQTNHEGLKAS